MRILVVLLLIAPGCVAEAPRVVTCDASVRGDEACLTWSAVAERLGCSTAWCPYATRAAPRERACVEDLQLVATCAELALAADTCSACTTP